MVTLLSDFEKGVVVALVKSDENGRFRLETSVPAGELERIAVSSKTCGTGDVPPSLDRELVVELTGQGALTVTVVDETGRAIDGADVRIARRTMPSWMYKRRSRKLNPALEATRKPMDAKALEGVARFDPLPSGEWSVVASAKKYSPSSSTVVVGSDAAALTLTLGGIVTVSGRVTDALTGNPLKGVRVVARLPHAGRGGFARANTDAEGRYSMVTRPGQRQTLAFKKRGYVTYENNGVIGEVGEHLERDATLSIVDARRGKFRSYVGIGAVLKKLDEGGVRIEKTIAGGPAAASLVDGDIVVTVDGEDVSDMPLKEVVERILGEEGEPVELEVQRDGEDQVVELERARMRVKR